MGAARQCQGNGSHRFHEQKVSLRVAESLTLMPGVSECDRVCFFYVARDVLAPNLHGSGGDGSVWTCSEHASAGTLHPQALLRQRNLQTEAQDRPET